MLRYNLKIIYRNFLYHKSSSMIKTLGLVMGITTSFLIFQYIVFEKSYDKFHNNYENIYRIGRQRYNSANDNINDPGITTSLMMGPVLKEDHSEITDYVRIHPMYGEATIQINESRFCENKMFFSDPTFFSIFNFKIIKGDPAIMLTAPNAVVISESIAKKYFGDNDPVGKELKLYSRYVTDDYTVTGVYKDFPANTHLEIDALFSMERLMNFRIYSHDVPWKWGNFRTYIRTTSHTSENQLLSLVRETNKKYKVAELIEAYSVNYSVSPITDIHLDGKRSYLENHGSELSIMIFIFIGVLIIATSWFNYINLSVSGFFTNFKLFRIKSQLGISKQQTTRLFITDNVLLNSIAFIISFILVKVLHSLLERFSELIIELPAKTEVIFWVLSFLTVICISIFSAILAILFFEKILKNKDASESKSSRIGFITLQYLSSFILLVISLVSIKQLYYLKNQDLGISISNIITIQTPKVSNPEIENRNTFEVFREEILKLPGVKAVANSVYIPGIYIASIQSTGLLGKNDKKYVTRINYTSSGYADVYQNKLLAGRFHKAEEEIWQNVVINETAAKQYGFKDPKEAIGQTLHWYHSNRDSRIIGVIEDYNHESPDIPTYSMAIYKVENIRGFYNIRLSSINYDMISKVKQVFEKVHPGNPFNMQISNDLYDQQYSKYERQVKMFIFFAIVAIIISVIGLISIVQLSLQKRIKEIGVRKVNGAKIYDILSLLNKQYIKVLLIAVMIGIPVSQFTTSKWIENFAVKTSLSWWIFGASCMLLLVITIITISWQSWQVARRNPVESLRYE